MPARNESLRTVTNNIRKFVAGRGPVADKPCILSKKDVLFLATYVMEEIMELIAVTDENYEEVAKEALSKARRPKPDKVFALRTDITELDIMTAQADAYGDIIAYASDPFVTNGYNVGDIINCVVSNNLNKVWPDGKLHVTENHIDKPPGFIEANVEDLILDMLENGSWSDSQTSSSEEEAKKPVEHLVEENEDIQPSQEFVTTPKIFTDEISD